MYSKCWVCKMLWGNFWATLMWIQVIFFLSGERGPQEVRKEVLKRATKVLLILALNLKKLTIRWSFLLDWNDCFSDQNHSWKVLMTLHISNWTIDYFLLLLFVLRLPKIANCGEVCASQLVPLRQKSQEDYDVICSNKVYFFLLLLYVQTLFFFLLYCLSLKYTDHWSTWLTIW